MLLDACSLAKKNFDVLVSLLIDAFKIQSGFPKLDQIMPLPRNARLENQSVDPLKSRIRSKSPTKSRGRFNNFGQIYSRKSRKRWSGHVTRIRYQSNVCEWAWEKVSRWGWWICPRWANLHFVGDSVIVTPFWWHLEMREFGTMKDLIYFCLKTPNGKTENETKRFILINKG